MNKAGLQKVLQEQYKCGNECDQGSVRIDSLAEAPDGQTLIATISFLEEPSWLLRNRKDQITVPLKDFELTDHEQYTLTVDEDFLGLTTLYCPDDGLHKVEYGALLKYCWDAKLTFNQYHCCVWLGRSCIWVFQRTWGEPYVASRCATSTSQNCPSIHLWIRLTY